jgi:hypothetical protein
LKTIGIIAPALIFGAQLAAVFLGIRRRVRGAYTLLVFCACQVFVPLGLFVALRVFRTIIPDPADARHLPQLGSNRDWLEFGAVLLCAVLLVVVSLCLTTVVLIRLAQRSRRASPRSKESDNVSGIFLDHPDAT